MPATAEVEAAQHLAWRSSPRSDIDLFPAGSTCEPRGDRGRLGARNGPRPQGSAPRSRDVFPRHLPPRLAPIGCLRGNRGGAEWECGKGRIPGGGRGFPFPAPPLASSPSQGRFAKLLGARRRRRHFLRQELELGFGARAAGPPEPEGLVGWERGRESRAAEPHVQPAQLLQGSPSALCARSRVPGGWGGGPLRPLPAPRR